MLKYLKNNLKGDKGIWSLVTLLALVSFMPVFSASSNLAYIGHGTGNTLGYLVKHFIHICVGFVIIYWVHKLPVEFFKRLSLVGLPVTWVLLIYTLFKGTVIAGANASRWIQIPFIGITFQTSTIASVILYLYVARYLSNLELKKIEFKKSMTRLWLPVFFTLALILPANFSTTALIFMMVVMLVFIGNYPLKYLSYVIGICIVFLMFFVLLSKAFPENKFFSRVNTWESRITNFTTDRPDEDDYQIEKAKTAIASGRIYGLGPGKSVQKNFLPQSSSDFIFAIIVEEYGFLGGMTVIAFYLLLLLRFVVVAHKSNTLFAKLAIAGLGFPIIFQALVNMAVAVELMPVTGQTLPLISSGGSSIWTVCFAIGIILSVTKKEEEITQDRQDAERREQALKNLIDRELNETEDPDDFSILEDQDNPMNAVVNK